MAEPRERRRRKRRGWAARLLNLRQGAGNALEVIRLGRLGASYRAPFSVVHTDSTYRLRRYEGPNGPTGGVPLVLVPPLMLTAEIYDVAPDLSGVGMLVSRGVDAWVVDFGAPEREKGGMERTLDDHVRAVADAVRRARAATGKDVHLGGYSQGGMFAYQAAAYLRSEGIASVITFGSPVNIHANLPALSTDVTARLIGALRPMADAALRRIEGIPGTLSSTGFKIMTPKKEIEQLVDFVRKLHDRQALEKRESRRRFLGGEGFVAWPGPALRTFVDDFVVHNRMVSGGFVIDGRSVTLADITCPILYFVGGRDEMARPPSVRAIREAAPAAETHEVVLPAGHFGLVVGTTASQKTWPTVVDWIDWKAGTGPRPAALGVERRRDDDDVVEVEDAAFDEPLDVELFYDVALGTLESAWNRVGEAFGDAGDALDDLRWQLPRLHKLGRISSDTRVSFGRALADQARKIPDQTFFLWKGRAFTYADADRRVNHVVRGLISCGVQPGHRVGVVMHGRPSYLSMVTALNRIGAVAVLLSPEGDQPALERALAVAEIELCTTDPDNAERARAAFSGRVLVLGGGPNRPVAPGCVDMEAIDPELVELPYWYRANPGRASELAIVIVSSAGADVARAARITNRRWAFSAYGAAAACTLTPKDTVYCALPLHHPAGLLVSVGGALVGGSRLALATRFEAGVFWSEVRRYGASVVFYAGEMARELVNAPSTSTERGSPLRLLAGSGIRKDLWQKVVERFGVGVLEFYAATEVALVLANAAGEKVGALGRPLPGSTEVALVEWDFESADLRRDAHGRALRAATGTPGVMIAKVDAEHHGPAPARPGENAGKSRLRHSVLEPGDAWYVSGDLLRRDADGDYWFVERLRDVIHTAAGPVFPRAVEDALYEVSGIAQAVVVGGRSKGSTADVPIAIIVAKSGEPPDLDTVAIAVERQHGAAAVPRVVRLVSQIPMNEGFRPLKRVLESQPVEADGRTYEWDATPRRYVVLA